MKWVTHQLEDDDQEKIAKISEKLKITKSKTVTIAINLLYSLMLKNCAVGAKRYESIVIMEPKQKQMVEGEEEGIPVLRVVK